MLITNYFQLSGYLLVLLHLIFSLISKKKKKKRKLSQYKHMLQRASTIVQILRKKNLKLIENQTYKSKDILMHGSWYIHSNMRRVQNVSQY